MPIIRGHDSSGSYYKYGKAGKKYYYKSNNSKSREKAKSQAQRQGGAIKRKTTRR